MNVAAFKLIDTNLDKNDANELHNFIELEDYCRRTTAANSRVSVTTTHLNNALQETVLQKLQSKAIKKRTTENRNVKNMQKNEMRKSTFVKTFAITISKDDKIIYN